jgi:hypothetical protein
MATFSYQLTYWLWVMLEKDELRRDRQGEPATFTWRTMTQQLTCPTDEIDALETKLQGLVARKNGP